jgi:hypothetical protein
LRRFLDFEADHGFVAKGTAQSRKAACSKVLSVLKASEAMDVTAIDLDSTFQRFVEMHGSDYAEKTLISYVSRLRSAVRDFRSHLANPLAFRASAQQRDYRATGTSIALSGSAPSDSTKPQTDSTKSSRTYWPTGDVLPIAIRPDSTVYIQGLPFDLSEAEARKISAVVTALAQS